MNLDYNALAVYWEVMQRYSPAPRHRRRLILDMLREISFDSVLDVGCGRGLLLDAIGQNHSASLSGSDISEKAVNRNSEDFPDLDFYKLDLTKEALPQEFDVVICSEVLEHLADFENAMDNLIKMTKRYIIVTVPTCPLFESDKGMGHFRHFDGRELCEKLQGQGFEIRHFIKWGYPFFNLYKHLLNGPGSGQINRSFAQQYDYNIWQKIVCHMLYYLFSLNLKNYEKGYQLILMGCRAGKDQGE